MVWKIIVGSLVLVFFVWQLVGIIKDIRKTKKASSKDGSKVQQPENKKSDKEEK